MTAVRAVRARRVLGMYLLSDPGRVIGPLVLFGLAPLVLSDQQSWAGAAMLATSQAEYSVLILAPAAAITGSLSARSAALHGETWRSGSARNRLTPLVLVVVASFLWIAVAAVGIWVAVSLVSTSVSQVGYPFATTFGVSLSALLAATAAGAVVAARIRGVWAVIIVPFVTYLILALPVYLPSYPLFVLIPRSSVFFFPTATPSPIYAWAQIVWMLTVSVLLLLWHARIGRRPLLAAAIVIVAGVCLVISSQYPLLQDYGSIPGVHASADFDKAPVPVKLAYVDL